jgi:hypothetical protein
MLVLCGVVAAVGLGGGAEGWGPLREDHLGALCGTVVHMDLRHVVSTAWGRALLAGMSSNEEDDVLDEFTTDLGIDLGEEITGLTIYSQGRDALGASVDADSVAVHAAGDQTVMLIYGTDALARWDELLEAEQDDPSPDLLAGRPVREIDREDQHWRGVMLPDRGGDADDGGDGVVWVVAPGMDLLEAAVGVMEGRLERADLDAWPIAGPPEGSFLFVAVRDLDDLDEWAPASDVAKHAEGFSAAVGQRGEVGFARVRITVKSEEDAVAITGVCHGLLGLAQLTLADDESLRPLLQLAGRVRISAEERVVEALLEEDAARLADLTRELDGEE